MKWKMAMWLKYNNTEFICFTSHLQLQEDLRGRLMRRVPTSSRQGVKVVIMPQVQFYFWINGKKMVFWLIESLLTYMRYALTHRYLRWRWTKASQGWTSWSFLPALAASSASCLALVSSNSSNSPTNPSKTFWKRRQAEILRRANPPSFASNLLEDTMLHTSFNLRCMYIYYTMYVYVYSCIVDLTIQ